MICTLLGNRECPGLQEERLEQLLIDLICRQGVRRFYVGNHGKFDRKAAVVLQKICQKFAHVEYTVVLAYYPTDACFVKDHPTILADGVETVPPKFRIVYRNKWMIRQAQIVICYLHNIAGNTRDMAAYARSKGKEVIEID